MFTWATAAWLRAWAILIALAGIGAWFWLWGVAVSVEPDAGFVTNVFQFLGGLAAQAVVLAGLYLVVHVLFIRARHVTKLAHAEFTVVPITSVLLRTFGEVVAILAVLPLGVALGIRTMIGGPPWGAEYLADEPFLGTAWGHMALGLAALAVGLAIGVCILALFYFLAEALVVAVAIAKHSGRTSRTLDRIAASGAVLPSASPVTEELVVQHDGG